jgi:hypothetical protein
MKPSFEVKRGQLLLSLGVGLGFLTLLGMGVYLLKQASGPIEPSSHGKIRAIETAVTKIDPHEVWRIKLEEAMAETSQKVGLMEKMLEERLKSESPINDPQDSDSVTRDPVTGDVEALRQELESLKEQVTQSHPRGSFKETPFAPFGASETPTGHAVASHRVTGHGVTSHIGKLIFTLKDLPSRGLKKTTDTTIPCR